MPRANVESHPDFRSLPTTVAVKRPPFKATFNDSIGELTVRHVPFMTTALLIDEITERTGDPHVCAIINGDPETGNAHLSLLTPEEAISMGQTLMQIGEERLRGILIEEMERK